MRTVGRIVVFALLAALASWGQAPTVVSTGASASSYGGSTISGTLTIASGQIVYAVAYSEGFTTPFQYTFSGCGATWTTLQAQTTGGYTSAKGVGGSGTSCTVTATVSSGSNTAYSYMDWVVIGGASGTTDGNTSSYNSATNEGGVPVTTPSITTTVANDLVLGIWMLTGNNDAGTVTVNSPFTIVAASPTTNVAGGIASDAQSSPGAVSATFNNTGTTIYGAVAETVAFEASGGSPTPRGSSWFR